MWHSPPGFPFRPSYTPVNHRSAHLLSICIPFPLITLKYMKCIEMSRITSFPSILHHGGKNLVVASEFECGETGLLLNFLGHYVDGRLSVTTARTIYLIPSCWPCTQQRDLTGLDKILAGKSYMELLDKTIVSHDRLSIITFAWLITGHLGLVAPICMEKKTTKKQKNKFSSDRQIMICQHLSPKLLHINWQSHIWIAIDVYFIILRTFTGPLISWPVTGLVLFSLFNHGRACTIILKIKYLYIYISYQCMYIKCRGATVVYLCEQRPFQVKKQQ